MIPFLKKNKDASPSGILIQRRKPDEGSKPEDSMDESENPAMEAAAQDILRAIESKDSKHLALALRAAYDICESAEDESSDSDNSYDSLNAMAAKGNE